MISQDAGAGGRQSREEKEKDEGQNAWGNLDSAFNIDRWVSRVVCSHPVVQEYSLGEFKATVKDSQDPPLSIKTLERGVLHDMI